MSGTERCARQARTLGPNDFRVVAGRAEVLGFVGRWQDALEETREVEAFEPLPPNRHWEVVGVIYVALGRYAEAAEAFAAEAADASIRGYIQPENYFKNPEDLEPWLGGLRKAGLSEE